MTKLLNPELYGNILELKSGDSFIVKDNRGFTVFQVTDKGVVKQKGASVKL